MNRIVLEHSRLYWHAKKDSLALVKTPLRPIRKTVSLLLALILAFSLIQPVGAKTQTVGSIEVRREGDWKVVDTGVFTLKFPAEGKHPKFIWWYNKDNRSVYVAEYRALIEFYNATDPFFKLRSSISEEAAKKLFSSRGEEAAKKAIEDKEEALEKLKEIRESAKKSSEEVRSIEFRGKPGEKEPVKELEEKVKEIREDLAEARKGVAGISAELALRADDALKKLDEILNATRAFDRDGSRRAQEEVIRNIEKLLREAISLHERLEQASDQAAKESERGFEEAKTRFEEAKKTLESGIKKLHPPEFPFPSGKWDLTEVTPIVAADGAKIGITFTFKLVKVDDPKFKFAENNILIRNRMYSKTVVESVGNIKYNVTATQLKMDFIVSNWSWNIDALRSLVQQVSRLGLNQTLPETKAAGLALLVHLASLDRTKVTANKTTVEDEAERVERLPPGLSEADEFEVEGEGFKAKIKLKGDEDKEEKELKLPFESFRGVKMTFATTNATLAGFFSFIPNAFLIGGNGTRTNAPVRASYLETGAQMKLYLSYGYFGANTLEHDPSIGLEVKESITSAEYAVDVAVGTAKAPHVVSAVRSMPNQYLIVSAIAFTLIASVVIYVARRNRVEVLD